MVNRCHPSEIRKGDRLNHAGVAVIVDAVEQTKSGMWRIDFTYVDARYTSRYFFTDEPVLRYEDTQ